MVAGTLFTMPLRMKYMRTAIVQSDYWYVWVKSGLLEYVGKKLREKYKTPLLNEREDMGFGEIPIGDESVSDEYHKFYDKWDRKEEFRQELSEYVDQLHLHRSAFSEVFDFVFYGDPLNINREWTGIDTEAWFYPLGISDEYELRLVGYTRDEARDVVKRIKSNLKRDGIKATKEMNKSLGEYGKSIQRKIRQIKSKELYVAVIEELKTYKEPRKLGDEYMKRSYEDKVRNQYTSGECASKVAESLGIDEEKFGDSDFRKMTTGLYKEFPLLKEFISSVK